MQLENDSKQIEILLKKNILFYVFGVILFFAIIFLLNYIYFTKFDTKAFDEAKIFKSKMVETINNSKDKNVDDLEDDLIEVVKEWNSLYVVGIDVTRTHKSSFYIQKSNYKYVQFPNKTLLKIDLNKMINNQAHAFLIKTTLSFDNLILATYSIPHICKNIYFEKFIPFILSMIMVLSLMFLLRNKKVWPAANLDEAQYVSKVVTNTKDAQRVRDIGHRIAQVAQRNDFKFCMNSV